MPINWPKIKRSLTENAADIFGDLGDIRLNIYQEDLDVDEKRLVDELTQELANLHKATRSVIAKIDKLTASVAAKEESPTRWSTSPKSRWSV